jgi:hypothetical protein
MTDKVKVEVKPLPAIATRAFKLLWAQVAQAQAEITKEAADIAGVNLNEGWMLNDNATAFVKPDKKEKDDGSE